MKIFTNAIQLHQNSKWERKYKMCEPIGNIHLDASSINKEDLDRLVMMIPYLKQKSGRISWWFKYFCLSQLWSQYLNATLSSQANWHVFVGLFLVNLPINLNERQNPERGRIVTFVWTKEKYKDCLKDLISQILPFYLHPFIIIGF